MEEKMMQEPEGQGQQELDPAKQREVEAYVGSISKMLHGKQTKAKVYEMLKSAPPEKSVPEAVFLSNIRVAEKMKEKGKAPSIEALFSGVLFATAELCEIGNAGGFFEQEVTEENIQPVLQESIQRMVVEGVKRKLVDPIEFQQKIEPLLNDQQRQMGLDAAQKTGVPAEPNETVAMERYADQKVDKFKQMTAAKESAQNRQSMIQQAQGGQ